MRHIELAPSPRILDVGCGNGYFTYYLERLGPTVGVDYARAMLELNPCAALVQASAFHLPFGDSSFDLVFCSNLLHHLPMPVAAIAEMRRVSRRYIVIAEPNRNNPAILALGLAKAEERMSLHFTSSLLRSLAEQAELRVLACETLGFVTPNRMPELLVSLLKHLNGPSRFGVTSVMVCEVPSLSCRADPR